MPHKTIANRTVCVFALMAMIGVSPAHAIDYIHEHVPEAQKVGQGRMDFMIWDIYDAVLFAPQGQWQADRPFALQLTYLQNLYGAQIADRSVQEMRALGFDNEVKLAMWHTQMRDIFPDVEEGDVLTGLLTSNGHTVFYKGKSEIGRIKDKDFGHAFFSIWLDPGTRAPELRLNLLGLEKFQDRKENGNTEKVVLNGIHEKS